MNILFILLDDLGWNDVGVHNEIVITPNINKLVNESCELIRNYTFPVCGPTRAMIQTGKYAYKYGMQKLFDPWIDYGLDINLKIIPQYLQEKEFNSYAIGKWHLGHCRKEYLPHERGYKYHYGNLTGCIDHITHKHFNHIKEANIHDFSENGKPIYPGGHACKILTDKVLEILEKKENKFIYIAYLDPHVPLICPKRFNNISFLNNSKISEERKKYLGMIAHLDHQIGRIIEKLKINKIYDETIIWLMSDNGGWNLSWAGGDNYPFKDGKASFYNGGCRTFSFIKHKDIKIKKFNEIVHCVDVLPTILDFCDIYYNHEMLDGLSLFSYLKNNEKIQRKNLVLGFFGENHWCFIIDNLKFIKLKKTSRHHLGVVSGKICEEDIDYMECYDLLSDPEEKNNIIKEKIKEMKDKIEKQIEICLKERVYENFKKPSEEQIISICRETKFWGQQNENKISILSSDKEENINYVNSKNNLAELTGYDIFYK